MIKLLAIALTVTAVAVSSTFAEGCCDKKKEKKKEITAVFQP